MISPYLNRPKTQLKAASLMVRVMLRHNEVFRLPADGQELKVMAGVAWVTVQGCDIFLTSGEYLRLPSRREAALISALGRQPLILEVFGRLKHPFL